MDSLQEQVAGGIEASGLRGAMLVVAVSGGPDSLALLHSLNALQEPKNLRLHVAHIDHGLRPTSHDDAAFVERTADALGLPCTVIAVEVGSGSPEAAARDARYGALARIAAEQGADAIAVGHTMDDQAETVLMHIVRGSGLTGLRAMSVLGDLPTNSESSTKVFRPMLGVRRTETAAYCDELGLTPIFDHTNLDTGIPRNFLRLEAIPLLETLNPKVIEGLGRLTEAVSIDLDYIESRLDVVWPDLAEETGGVFVMKRDLFHALHSSLQRHALRRMYGEAIGSTAGLEGVHVESMLALVKGPAGKELTLPGGVRMETRFDAILLFPPGGDDRTLPVLQGQQSFNIPGDTVVDGWRVCAEIVSRPEELDAGDYTSYFDADSLAGTVLVRGWEDGDRFQPLGMAEGVKKLQDFYVDAHVPQSWRERVPLVVTTRGVAWVVGYRMAHWARVTPETQRVMKVEFQQL